MDFGIIFAQKIFKRNTIVRDTLCKPDIPEEDREILASSLQIQRTFNNLSRVSLIPFFYFLYRKGVFERPSAYYQREIFLTAACILGLSGLDLAINQWVWGRSIEIIKKTGVIREKDRKEKYLETQGNNTIKLNRMYED